LYSDNTNANTSTNTNDDSMRLSAAHVLYLGVYAFAAPTPQQHHTSLLRRDVVEHASRHAAPASTNSTVTPQRVDIRRLFKRMSSLRSVEAIGADLNNGKNVTDEEMKLYFEAHTQPEQQVSGTTEPVTQTRTFTNLC
jgi:hypothetical protein